jgi:hypothetical protein
MEPWSDLAAPYHGDWNRLPRRPPRSFGTRAVSRAIALLLFLSAWASTQHLKEH